MNDFYDDDDDANNKTVTLKQSPKVIVYKQNYKNKKNDRRSIVFDLDETIGDFYMFYHLLTFLREQYEYTDQSHVNPSYLFDSLIINQLLDLYREHFFRYGIIVIFKFLQKKKESGELDNIWLYTNNSLSPKFPHKICNYINWSLGKKCIDNIISAFNIDGRRVDIRRECKQKTYSDLLRCAVIPKQTNICFIDNELHEGMIHNKVFYIQPTDYHHGLSYQEILSIFIKGSNLYSEIFVNCTEKETHQLWYKYLVREKVYTGVNPKSMNKDKDITRSILRHIREFFILSNRLRRTYKNKNNAISITRKKIKKK